MTLNGVLAPHVAGGGPLETWSAAMVPMISFNESARACCKHVSTQRVARRIMVNLKGNLRASRCAKCFLSPVMHTYPTTRMRALQTTHAIIRRELGQTGAQNNPIFQI